jgi:hypothetical protein
MTVPTVSVVRLASDAPRVGTDHAFDYGGQQFCGRVVAITTMRRVKTICML